MAVEVYARENCMWCKKTKEWLTAHNIPFTAHDVTKLEDFNAMKERIPDAKTVPQIVIDGHVIGGYDILMAHEEPILKKLKKAYPDAT